MATPNFSELLARYGVYHVKFLELGGGDGVNALVCWGWAQTTVIALEGW